MSVYLRYMYSKSLLYQLYLYVQYVTAYISTFVAIIDKSFTPQLSLRHIQKDVRLAIEMADMYDQPLQVAASVNEVSY